MKSDNNIRAPACNPQRSEAQLALIKSMLVSLDPFFRLRPTIPARCVQAFFLVAEKEGLAVTEYAKRGELSPVTMSRNLIDMGERDRNHEEGPGLVESHENIMNRRETCYRLSPKGRALLASITAKSAYAGPASAEKRLAKSIAKRSRQP
jgi:DNA-binding MarR family transcriptional regulator